MHARNKLNKTATKSKSKSNLPAYAKKGVNAMKGKKSPC